MQVPDDLRRALEAELPLSAPREIATASQALSRRYRAEHGQARSPLLGSPLDARAYAAYRMPATFAALAAALGEVRDRLPDWAPRSVLDVGGGPGTASWAALEIWPDIPRVTVIERDAAMIEIGRALAAHATASALRHAEWLQADVIRTWEMAAADLVVLGYVLGEIPTEEQGSVVRGLWQSTHGACVIVEPGTPRGYALIRRAESDSNSFGAHLIAPNPSGWACLEHGEDWVHFAARVSRSRLHRAAKGATMAYEDEKFSYLAASRREGKGIAARVVRQPQVRTGHVRLTLCTASGIRHLVVTRKQKEAYRKARDLRWGSAIEADEAGLFGLESD